MKTTRLELFEQVWVTPMTKLAKNFGCSDVGLRKACIKFEIPLPPQGHWQKLLYGKGFAKPEIPRPKYNPEIEINPVAIKVAREAHQRDKAIEEALEKSPEQKLKPLKDLTKLHPLTNNIYDLATRYQQAIEKHRKNGNSRYRFLGDDMPYEDKGRFHYRPSDGCIPICASFSTMFRSLKILDPILKAWADEGYKFLFEEKDRYRQKEFAIEKDGEKMYINIREGYSKTSLSIKSQKLLEKLDVYSGDYRNYPNGVIYFEIKHEFKYYPEIFKDQKRIKLEQQMDLVLNYILEAPSDIKAERERRHREQVEYERKKAIRIHNENIVTSQHAQLDKALQESKLIQELRELENYLISIEATTNDFSDQEKRYAEHWLNIVRHFAEEKHPLKKRVNLFKKLATEPEDPYKYYWAKEEKSYVGITEDEDADEEDY